MDHTFPKIETLIPHAGKMCLLDRVVSNNKEGTDCTLKICEDSIFYDGSDLIPVWFGIEYMAQCVGAHVGLDTLSKNKSVQMGYFIGSRKVEFFTWNFKMGQELAIKARIVWEGSSTSSFNCLIEDEKEGVKLIQGRLNFFRPLVKPSENLSNAS